MICQKLRSVKPVQQKYKFPSPSCISKCSYHPQKFGRYKKELFIFMKPVFCSRDSNTQTKKLKAKKNIKSILKHT